MPEDPPRPDVPLHLAIQELGHNRVTNATFAGANERASWTFRQAPSIPVDGREGDVLIMRDGQPTWVSPREAFRLDCSGAPIGAPVDRNLFENLMTIEAREEHHPYESFSISRPPAVPEPPPKHRSAWEIILNADD